MRSRFSGKDNWACCSDGIWVAWGRSPSCERPSWSRWVGCSPSGQTPAPLETVRRMGPAYARWWTRTSESLHSASDGEKPAWNEAHTQGCNVWDAVFILIYLADEDHHPLLKAEQFIRHPLGLVEQSVGGVVITIKSSLQIEQGFHPRLHQNQNWVKEPCILHKTHWRCQRALVMKNPMFIDFFHIKEFVTTYCNL